MNTETPSPDTRYADCRTGMDCARRAFELDAAERRDLAADEKDYLDWKEAQILAGKWRGQVPAWHVS